MGIRESAANFVDSARSGAQAVYNVWTNAGDQAGAAELTERAKEVLAERWPTLSLAVDRVVEEYFRRNGDEEPIDAPVVPPTSEEPISEPVDPPVFNVPKFPSTLPVIPEGGAYPTEPPATEPPATEPPATEPPAEGPVETRTPEEIVASASSGEEAVFNAWTVPGRSTEVHEKAKDELLENWPVLALAVERIVEEQEAAAGETPPVGEETPPAGPGAPEINVPKFPSTLPVIPEGGVYPGEEPPHPTQLPA